jgi:hypothetical protein
MSGRNTRIVNFKQPHTKARISGCAETKVSAMLENSCTDWSIPNSRDETQRLRRFALTLSISAVKARIVVACSVLRLFTRSSAFCAGVRLARKLRTAICSGSALRRRVLATVQTEIAGFLTDYLPYGWCERFSCTGLMASCQSHRIEGKLKAAGSAQPRSRIVLFQPQAGSLASERRRSSARGNPSSHMILAHQSEQFTIW